MNIKVLAGSGLAVGALAVGLLAGSAMSTGSASAQAPAAVSSAAAAPVAPAAQVARRAIIYSDIPGAPAAQAAATSVPAPAQPAPKSSGSVTAKITQQQAEQAALAASPGNTVDHTSLQSQNGTAVYDVDFTNGGGAIVNGDTGAIITTEAANQDKGGRGGPGGPGGFGGGANQAALAAKATVTKQQAEQAALTASPGNTVDHSVLGGDPNGVVFWDVDFANGGGVMVNAQTGAVISTEAAGQDKGGRGGPGLRGGPNPNEQNEQQTPSATPQP